MPAPRVYLASPATHLTASATYGEAVQFKKGYVACNITLLGTPVHFSWAQRRVDQSDLARRTGRLPVLEEAGARAIYLADAGRRGGDDLTGADGLFA
jgi:hypothetical protein